MRMGVYRVFCGSGGCWVIGVEKEFSGEVFAAKCFVNCLRQTRGEYQGLGIDHLGRVR